MDVETNIRNAVHVIQERLRVAFDLIDVYCEMQAEINYSSGLHEHVNSFEHEVAVKEEAEEIVADHVIPPIGGLNSDDMSLEIVLQEKCIIREKESDVNIETKEITNEGDGDRHHILESSKLRSTELEEELLVLHELLESASLLAYGNNRPGMTSSSQFILENQFFDLKNSCNARNLELIKLQNELDRKAKEDQLETEIFNEINHLNATLQEIEDPRNSMLHDDDESIVYNESGIKLLTLLQ